MKRFRPRFSLANVLSMLALFAALGGSYALAFAGSGSLQKGALLNIPTTDVPVRSLTGIGNIRVGCDDTNPDDVFFHFQNTSGELLTLRGEGQSDHVPNNSISTGFNAPAGQFIGHIGPTDGTKAPQVHLLVSVLDTDNCVTSVADVLALNTQQ